MRAVRFTGLSLVFPAVLACTVLGQQQAVPDAPAPQTQTAPPSAPVPQAPSLLPDLKDQVAPGKGTTSPDDQQTSPGVTPPQTNSGTASAPAPQQPPPPDAVQQTPPETGTASQIPILRGSGVTEVIVPVTVRDKHGKEIPGLPSWRFKVFEDGVQQRIVWFSTDAFPLSIAFVIDATLPEDVMDKVNRSLPVVSTGLTPADTVALVSYGGTGPQLVTDFTAANGPRLIAALQIAKKPGEQMGVPMTEGPFASGPMVNGQQADPTLAPQRGNASGFLLQPKDVHPLNDAILFAAEQLASQPTGRRRVIYVISDGKNSRSKADYKEVRDYLLAHNITVSGTQVGDSAIWGIGALDRQKLPFLQPEDLLPRYCVATGGDVDHELSENGIQEAFVKIADSVRTAYTLIYASHQPTISGKYHNIEVRVEGLSGLDVIAKQGYYPTASEQ